MNGDVLFLKRELSRLHLVSKMLYNKQNDTWLLPDMEFLFSCSTRYPTSERSEQVRLIELNIRRGIR